MATIGTVKKTGDEYTGEIVTLTVQARQVRIVPVDRRPSDSAPSHRVCAGQAEIGAAWTKTSREGRDYLGLKLDAPSFAAPVFANLVEGEDGEGYRLIWSRPTGRTVSLHKRLVVPIQSAANGGMGLIKAVWQVVEARPRLGVDRRPSGLVTGLRGVPFGRRSSFGPTRSFAIVGDATLPSLLDIECRSSPIGRPISSD